MIPTQSTDQSTLLGGSRDFIAKHLDELRKLIEAKLSGSQDKYFEKSFVFNVDKLLSLNAILATSIISKADEIDFVHKKIKELGSEAGKIVQGMQAENGKVAVEHFAQRFQKTAKNFDCVSLLWLCLAAIFAIGTGFIAYNADVLFNISGKAWPEILQPITSKIIIIVLMLSATIFCARQYKVAQHQYSINQHRADALSTFRRFTDATKDNKDVYNAILLETTVAIFSSVPSGYLDKGQDVADSMRIAEIAAKIISGK
jgi:hypothetical protein